MSYGSPSGLTPEIKSYVWPEEPPRKESKPCSAVTMLVGT